MKILPAGKNIFLIYKFQIFDLKVQGLFQDFLLKMGDLPGHFQDKIKSQDISRISGHLDIGLRIQMFVFSLLF